MKIVLAPNPILRAATSTVLLPAAKLAKIITEMKAALVAQKDPEGVGLAANQVGLPYSLFLARFETKKDSPIHTFINPKIISHADDLAPQEGEKAPLEGCLSLPNFYGIVKRYRWVELTFLDKNQQEKTEKFAGFAATVIQHEMDHLSGKIFVERILEQQGQLFKSTGKDKRGKDLWEEVEI